MRARLGFLSGMWYIFSMLKLSISKSGLFLLCVFLFVLSSFGAQAASYRYVKVEGKRLMVDFAQTGTYTPFFIKGAGYQPYPIGRYNTDWGYPSGSLRSPNIPNMFADPDILTRDFALLKTMNANTVRIWTGNDTRDPVNWPGRFPNMITSTTLDNAKTYGIRVIAGFYVNAADAISTDAKKTDAVTRFTAYVTGLKDNAGLLFWAIGNEDNLSLNASQYPAWYALVDRMAAAAHTAEGEYYHPVAIVNGDVLNIGNATYGTTDSQMPHLDIWGANVYRGISFGTLFSEYQAKSAKPFWVAEFGLDAYNSGSYSTPDAGGEDQATQSLWDGKLWDEIALNSDTAIGGTMMEYSDEWWKPYEWQCSDSAACNSRQDHFGYITSNAPDNFWHEEWWGLMKISRNADPTKVDVMTPRLAYTTLQAKFAKSVFPPVMTAITDKAVYIGQPLQFTVSATDPEGRALVLTARMANGNALSTIGATFTDNGNGSGVFRWTPSMTTPVNPYSVQFIATDPFGLTDTKTALITVTANTTPLSTYALWRDFKWGAGVDPVIYGPSVDTDGDGLVNLLEYMANMDPRVNNPSSDMMQYYFVAGTNGQKYFTVKLRRNKAVTDYVYSPAASTNLVTYTENYFKTPVTTQSIDTNTEWVLYTDAQSTVQAPSKFYRVSVKTAGTASAAGVEVMRFQASANPGIVYQRLAVEKVGGGSVVSGDAGIDCGDICFADVLSNTTVTLTAAASAHNHFDGWSGACAGTGPCVVKLDAAKTVGASFSPELYCGDGAVNGAEQCDGVNLNGQTCQGQGFDAGTLQCSSSCGLDTAGCFNYQCTGVPPANASVCAGDGSGLKAMTPYTLSAACTAVKKCEAVCNAQYQFLNGACARIVSTPAGVRAVAVTGRVVLLTWQPSTDLLRKALYYTVSVSTDGKTFVSAGRTEWPVLVISGLKPLTRYYFRVQASDAAGNVSEASAAVPLTTIR